MLVGLKAYKALGYIFLNFYVVCGNQFSMFAFRLVRHLFLAWIPKIVREKGHTKTLVHHFDSYVSFFRTYVFHMLKTYVMILCN